MMTVQMRAPFRLALQRKKANWNDRGVRSLDHRRWYWVPLTVSAEQLFGEPELFAEGEYLNLPGLEYAVSPDGSRILDVRGMGRPTTTTLNVVVTNWFEAAVGND